MNDSSGQELEARMRELPSIDEILNSQAGAMTSNEIGRERTLGLSRGVLEKVRNEIDPDGRIKPRSELLEVIGSRLEEELETRRRGQISRVINATGVIVHTTLGRAPLSEKAAAAVLKAAGYCNLEFDLQTGKRGQRGAAVESMLAEIADADGALIVNNGAAAALLVLSALAKDGEVIVSRGELVEIGGDFRIPDVLEQSGAVLREVGTTNRTKIADYEKAISVSTRLILRVHPSNYRIIGFTECPNLSELSLLAKKNGLILVEDAGSGALIDLGLFGVMGEPVIVDVFAEGADLVTFSGDKLLGGVQAGLIVGRQDLIETLRKNSLYRALRPAKITYAAIEATLQSYFLGAATDEIPVMRMLALDPAHLKLRSDRVAERIRSGSDNSFSVEVIGGVSAIGGGAGPGIELPTSLIALSHSSLSAKSRVAKLRKNDPPVIVRIEDGRVLIDLRTVAEDEESELVEAILACA